MSTRLSSAVSTAPIAHPSEVAEGPGGKLYLVIQASIEGQDQTLLLALDALLDFVSSDQGVVKELRGIREMLGLIHELLMNQQELAGMRNTDLVNAIQNWRL